MLVAKCGNSLAVRLPAAVVEALELKEGDDIEIRIADRRELEVSRKPIAGSKVIESPLPRHARAMTPRRVTRRGPRRRGHPRLS
jgi:antitoxin component of MazEF toxin-antitoxin module